jgi:hypothetical protein
VTHSFDQNQRINFLSFAAGATAVTATAPANANVCPPGHYMLFLLNKSLIPSVAKIIQIQAQPAATTGAARPAAFTALHVLGPVEKDVAIVAKAKRPPVLVGLTATCPYGLAACWGGAYSALSRLPGVEIVRPIADAKDSLAILYLNNDGLPDVQNWPANFARLANASYGWRGVEVTLRGAVQGNNGLLVLAGDDTRPPVALSPLEPGDKIQWNLEARSSQLPTPDEQLAYRQLAAKVRSMTGPVYVTVTGPLKVNENGYYLKVRRFT